MATLVQLLPMRLLFVGIVGFLPILLTIYDRGVDDISGVEWASFAIIALGSILVFVVSDMKSSVEMQRLLWPLLAIMGIGLLVYRTILVKRGEFEESTIERGGTSYDD
ncbi:MAG: hypothetical protein ABEJ85_00225 [Haloarculaceae archaeon]